MDKLDFQGSCIVFDEADLSEPLAESLLDCGRPGPNDVSVAYVMEHFQITGDAADCRRYLDRYGAWSEAELADHRANLERLVWLSGHALAEGECAYFS